MIEDVRRRIGEYRIAGDIPPTPEGFECSVWRKLSGSLIVGIVGVVLTLPFGLALLVAASWVLPIWITALLAFALAPGSYWFGTYVGGPVADHVLDIPREVSE